MEEKTSKFGVDASAEEVKEENGLPIYSNKSKF